MSQEEILRNVYTFLQILEASRTKEVEEWDVQALKNALKWAEWCKTLSMKASGKGYEQDLDNEVGKLNHLPWSLGNCRIDLNYLRDATVHLTFSLLENACLTSTLYSFFIENCLDIPKANNEQPIFVKTCAKLAVKKETTAIANDLLTDVTDVYKSGSVNNDLLRQTYALHLLKFVGGALEQMVFSAKQRTVLFLNKKLRKMIETLDKGLDLLLLCLHVEGDHFNAQMFILNCIKDHISVLSENERRCMFSSMNTKDLCVLAKNCCNTLSIICDWLECEGKIMAPYIEHGKLSWRSTDDDGISYGLLIDTTQQLRLCDSNVASYIHKRLFSYPETAYCVWHSVQRQLYKSKQTYAKC